MPFWMVLTPMCARVVCVSYVSCVCVCRVCVCVRVRAQLTGLVRYTRNAQYLLDGKTRKLNKANQTANKKRTKQQDVFRHKHA